MRLQNLLIIFIAIALPVMILLQVFIGYQIDTVNLRTQYDNKLLGATYDTMTTFQLNTTNNIYSTVSDTLIRDIEASINIFTMQFATTIGKTGADKTELLSYVPALLFTLYDGYYIYTPVTKEDGTVQHMLKPYVYYTQEYKYGTDSKLIINYSLDNYVVVYNYDNDEFTSRAGYLEYTTTNANSDKGIYYNSSTKVVKYNGVEIDKEEELKILKYDTSTGNNIETTEISTSAYDYYKDSYEFSRWYNELIKKAFQANNQDLYKKLYITDGNSALPNSKSAFNNEKEKVIENIITNNLMQAMDMYGRKSSIDFNMPKLTAEDWNKIFHNVCVISFIQGLPVGTAKYNNYVIVPSTENKQYINEVNLFYVGSDGAYHRLGCEHLEGDKFTGYNKSEFSRQAVIYNNGNVFKKKDANNVERTVYYYPHSEMACYYCVVSAKESKNDLSELKAKEIKAYYMALAREKYDLVKLSNYVNGSTAQSTVNNSQINIADGEGEHNHLTQTTIFLNNMDNSAMQTIIGKYGEPLNNLTSIPHRTGYTFKGYYEEQNGSGIQYFDEIGKAKTEWNQYTSTATIYAKWKAYTSSVRIDPQGGQGNSGPYTATYGEPLSRIAPFYRSSSFSNNMRIDYEFNGIFERPYGQGAQYIDRNGNPVRPWNQLSSTATLFVHWIERRTVQGTY